MSAEYNQRQYRRMLEILHGYAARRIGLHRTIADLEALLLSLQDVPDVWKKSFYRQWGVLEDLYASLLDEALDKLPPELQALVDNAVEAMQALIAEVHSDEDS